MRKSIVTLVFSLLVVVFPAANLAQEIDPSPLPSIDLPAELDRVLRDYETAWAAGNPAALAKLFTEDGFLLSGGSQPIRGRAEIRNRYSNAGGLLLLRSFAYEMGNNLDYIFGAYTYTEGTDQGKFVLTLKKVGDKWLITSDQDNPIRDE